MYSMLKMNLKKETAVCIIHWTCMYLNVFLLQAWSQFSSQLEDLALPQHRASAVQCLNLLITNALQHVPDVLLYMSRIRNQSVFNFCAIPQVCVCVCVCVCMSMCMCMCMCMCV